MKNDSKRKKLKLESDIGFKIKHAHLSFHYAIINASFNVLAIVLNCLYYLEIVAVSESIHSYSSA